LTWDQAHFFRGRAEEGSSTVERPDIESLVERLAETPGRLATAAEGLTPERLATPPAADEWSALAVLAHMRASDDILSPRLVMMLVRDEPTMPAFDERRWGEVMAYEQSDYQELLAGLTFRRAELVRVLRRLKPADWNRTGQHEARGTITLFDTLRHLVEHEDEHLLQIEALLAGG
jgi:hypothetical protein